MQKAAKRYSVYQKKTDKPIAIYATAKECAKAMGIKLNTFRKHISRIRGEKNLRKWCIYEDELEDLEEQEGE